MPRNPSYWLALPVLLVACGDGAPASAPLPDASTADEPAPPDQVVVVDQPPPMDQPPPVDAPAPTDSVDAGDDLPAPVDAPAPTDAHDASDDVVDATDALDVVDATDATDALDVVDATDVTDVTDVTVDLGPLRCTGNADCATSSVGPVCDTVTGSCAVCTAGDRGRCAATEYCTSERRCETGCGADSDCSGASARCDVAAHRCVACVTDAHCPLGSLCGTDRVCAAGCNVGHGCPGAQACCAGQCLSTTADVANCGACGRACLTGERCVDGACVPPPPSSCAVILRRDRMAVSGTYTVVPPGGAAVEVTCDFSTGRGYTFFRGGAVPASASAILGACPTGARAFEVRSDAHAAALRRYVVSSTPMDRWYQANFFAGPASNCPTIASLGGWLRSPTEWVNASVRAATLSPLDMAENCLNMALFDPIQLNDRVGFSNRGCTACRVLYNSTEQELPATVVCSVNDVLACPSGMEDCDGDASNGCELRVADDASNCGACNRRCAAGEVCSLGACSIRSSGTFLPPPPALPTGSPAVMATGISGPQGLLVAPDGRVYVTALSAGTIVRIDPSATPPTQTAFATGFSEPAQLAMNTPDALVVAERSGNRVTRIAINPDGTAGARSTVATGFSGPWGVTWESSGSLLVSNEFGSTVDRVSATGAVTRGVVSGFNGPLDMRFAADGRLWVAQYFGTGLGNGTLVHQYDPSFARLRSVSGFSGPIGIALDAAGNAYVSSYDGGVTGVGRIQRVTPDGAVTLFSSGLSGPHAVAFDASGGLWVCDYSTNRVLRIGGR